MKLLNKLMLAALIISMGFAFNACEDNTTDPIDDPDVPAPTGLAATSIVDTEEESYGIRFKFEAPDNLDESMFEEYRINIYPENEPSNGVEYGFTEVEGGTQDELGLELETVYVIEVRTVYSNGDESSAISMNWAPATRFVQVQVDPIRLYASDVSDLGSGLELDIYDDVFEEWNVNVRTVANIQNWHLGLDTKTANVIKFGSASQLNYDNSNTAASAEIVFNAEPANGFGEVFDSEGLNNKSYQETVIDLNTINLGDKNGLVIYTRLPANADEYKYAKIFIKAPGQEFLQTEGGNSFIEIEISFQTAAGLPYAKR